MTMKPLDLSEGATFQFRDPDYGQVIQCLGYNARGDLEFLVKFSAGHDIYTRFPSGHICGDGSERDGDIINTSPKPRELMVWVYLTRYRDGTIGPRSFTAPYNFVNSHWKSLGCRRVVLVEGEFDE